MVRGIRKYKQCGVVVYCFSAGRTWLVQRLRLASVASYDNNQIHKTVNQDRRPANSSHHLF